MGPMRELDLAIFRAINNGPDWLAPPMVFFSDGNKWWWVRILLGGLFIYLLTRRDLRPAAILALVAFPIANAATDALKFAFQGLRPCVELDDVVVRVKLLTSFGTASAHSANMMAVAVVFFHFSRPWGWAWLVVAVMTGISRVFVGVHYPYQVLLGWLVGALTAFIVTQTWLAYRRLKDGGNRPDAAPAGES